MVSTPRSYSSASSSWLKATLSILRRISSSSVSCRRWASRSFRCMISSRVDRVAAGVLHPQNAAQLAGQLRIIPIQLGYGFRLLLVVAGHPATWRAFHPESTRPRFPTSKCSRRLSMSLAFSPFFIINGIFTFAILLALPMYLICFVKWNALFFDCVNPMICSNG